MGAQRQRSEPQVDRDPTLFFGWQTIGVDSCQGADQSCLAVVDMPRRSQDQVALAACHRCLARSSIRPPLSEVSLAVLSTMAQSGWIDHDHRVLGHVAGNIALRVAGYARGERERV